MINLGMLTVSYFTQWATSYYFTINYLVIPSTVLPKISIQVGTNPSFNFFSPLFFGNTDTVVVRKQCPPLSQLHHGHALKVIGLDGAIESMEFSCNNSYVLIGNSRRTCQPNGTWSGRQPHCIKGIFLFDISKYCASFSITKPEQSCSNGCVAACREPKISKVVRQKVLKPQLSLRYKLYSHFFCWFVFVSKHRQLCLLLLI